MHQRARRLGSSWALLPLLACLACVESVAIDDAALADESRGDDWLAFGRTYSEQRFSPLTQVDTSNVANLKVDWYFEMP